MALCPACKTEGPPRGGRFCSHCGAIQADAPCARCGTALSAGARFCHNCGSPVASQALVGSGVATPTQSSRIPWIIAGTATAAVLVLVIAQQLNVGASPRGSSAPAADAAAPALRAPDISQMSPRDRAARLYDRIMRLDEEGKRDSVQLFASMAIPTFQSLAPLDNHLRYDLGRVAAAAGQLDMAQAHADTILASRPRHLLGIILAARVAERRGDSTTAARLRARLIAAEASERAAGLEEYQLHDADIRAAVAAARERR